MDSKMGESSINCSFILIGLLWGEGDFFETLRIISLAGHGGDSTTPVGVGIVAIINGFDCIPQEALDKTWQDGQGVVVNQPIKDQKQDYWMVTLGLPERIKMADIVDMYQKNFESILKENGGFIYEGHYFIPKTKTTVPATSTVIFENFEKGDLSVVKSLGSTSLANSAETYMGEYGLKIAGGEDKSSGAVIEIDGLTVGAQYKYSAYVYTATKTQVYMFARGVGENGLGQRVSVYGSEVCVLREFVFEATAEKMEIGVYMPEGVASHKFATVDDICVMKVEEKKVTDKVSILGDNNVERTGSFGIKVEEAIKGEALVKITFANDSGKIINASMSINGEKYGAVPFYKTGVLTDEPGLDSVYIPVVLSGDTNELTFTMGERDTLYIFDAEIVSLTERFN